MVVRSGIVDDSITRHLWKSGKKGMGRWAKEEENFRGSSPKGLHKGVLDDGCGSAIIIEPGPSAT